MKFSVLMAVYHRDNPVFLQQALTSLFEQTLLPDEIVIVQDGPISFELTEVLSSFIKHGIVEIKLYPLEKNAGLGNALRVGIMECRNEWIARMDADDLSEKNRFFKQINFLNVHSNIDVLGCAVEEFLNQPHDSGIVRKMPVTHNEIIKFSKLRSPVNHPSCIFRKSKVLLAGNYNTENRMEDYWLFVRMLAVGCVFHNLDECLYSFRVGENMDMLRRRSGYKYAKEDFRFAIMAKKINYFSLMDTLKFILVKVPIRLMPLPVISMIYRRFLRSKAR
jgi:glycosyltransferase involved in cell wall biosynthesis